MPSAPLDLFALRVTEIPSNELRHFAGPLRSALPRSAEGALVSCLRGAQKGKTPAVTLLGRGLIGTGLRDSHPHAFFTSKYLAKRLALYVPLVDVRRPIGPHISSAMAALGASHLPAKRTDHRIVG